MKNSPRTFSLLSLSAALMLMGNSGEAPHQSNDAKLKVLLGVTESELYSCTVDSDCALVGTFTDCCTYQSINSRYLSIVRGKAPALFDAFASEQTKERCSLIECMPLPSVALCKKDRCVAEEIADTKE